MGERYKVFFVILKYGEFRDLKMGKLSLADLGEDRDHTFYLRVIPRLGEQVKFDVLNLDTTQEPGGITGFVKVVEHIPRDPSSFGVLVEAGNKESENWIGRLFVGEEVNPFRY
ncbi:MAG: hypothetical protein WC457_01715 [Patescibacteria group bacterium]